MKHEHSTTRDDSMRGIQKRKQFQMFYCYNKRHCDSYLVVHISHKQTIKHANGGSFESVLRTITTIRNYEAPNITIQDG